MRNRYSPIFFNRHCEERSNLYTLQSKLMTCLLSRLCRSLPRQATSFVLKQKKQKFKTAELLLCRTWPPLQNRQNLGWKHLPLASPRIPNASVKISYALQPHRPPLFCRFSPEAYLLSGFSWIEGVSKLFQASINCFTIESNKYKNYRFWKKNVSKMTKNRHFLDVFWRKMTVFKPKRLQKAI